MDIIAASNIGMTNNHKCSHEKCKCNHKQEPSKLYLLIKINYTIDGKLGNNELQITMCNKQALLKLAQEYYSKKNLHYFEPYINMDISKVENAIQILTKREYLHIAEIDEDKVGSQLIKNKEVFLTSINNFN